MVYTIPNFTNQNGGIEVLLAETTRQYTGAGGLILAFIFLSILGAGYFIQDRSKGNGNLFMWASISGLITTTASFILLIYGNIVSLTEVTILMLVTIVSSIAFLISNRE